MLRVYYISRQLYYIGHVTAIVFHCFQGCPYHLGPLTSLRRHDFASDTHSATDRRSLFRNLFVHLSIESHFVGVHGPYELHWKEEQIKCTALAVHENLLFFPMQFIWPVNTDKCDSILIFTSFYNKVFRDIAYFNTKMAYLLYFKRTKSKTLRTASIGRMTIDELNIAALRSSANYTDKRSIF